MTTSQPTPLIPSPPLVPGGREDKFVTQDGAIWPLARAAMTEPNAIRRRMAEDVADIARERGEAPTITEDDLRFRGWSRSQVSAHGDHAMSAFLQDA